MKRQELEAAVLAALTHDADARVNTGSIEMIAAPDRRTFVVFYDFWEFHMGATSAKIALVDSQGHVLRALPFDNTSTGAGHLATFSADGHLVCFGEPGAAIVWSLADERFAVVRTTFTPSSLTLTTSRLRIRQHTYRWGKSGGEYTDGPDGAEFALADLQWHDARELGRLQDILAACTPKAAGPLGV